MHIVADENIPFVEQAFGSLGHLKLVNGRKLSAADIKNADALIVRSVTTVDAALLRDSAVQFLGSATTGINHIDTDYLQAHNIAFAYAPGSNAASVVEYVLSAVLLVSQRLGQSLQGKTAGIIGYGNIGSRLANALQALGVDCLIYDPPLEAAGKAPAQIAFATLEQVQQADIISLHVPLTKDGSHPTLHLVDEHFLAMLKPAAILLNTSRGSVIDNEALNRHLQAQPLNVVLDVWENEPDINLDLLKCTQLATPHIAGYSIDGKLAAVQAVLSALAGHFGLLSQWEYESLMPRAPDVTVDTSLSAEGAIRAAVLQAYNIEQDDSHLRAVLKQPESLPALFDALRANYPPRRNFSAFQCHYPGSEVTQNCLWQLGFKVI